MYAMIKVSASELQRSLGSVSDAALREDVTITKQGRNHLVLLSYGEYARLKRRDRTVGLAGELSDEWLEAVRKAEVPAPEGRTKVIRRKALPK
jgi:prevent-host-death family protein